MSQGAPLWIAAAGGAAYLTWLLASSRPQTFARLSGPGFTLVLLGSFACARYAKSNWRVFVARTLDLHLLVLAMIAGLAAQQLLTEGITSDGCLYFAHLRSLVFDRDLQIGPELEVLRLQPRPHHVVPVGPAVVWAPLYLLVTFFDWIGRTASWVPAANPGQLGLTGAYGRSALLSSYLVAAVGLLAVHVRLRREFGAAVALATSVLLAGATSLAWYAIYEPAMSHAASFGVVAIFVIVSDRWLADRLTPARATMLGALFSVVVLVRPQDAVFGGFPIALLLQRRQRLALTPSSMGRSALWAAAGAAPLLAVQAALAAALLAQQPFQLLGASGYLRFFDPHLLDVLFSSRHGLLSWTPVMYLALAGTVAYLKRDRWWATATIAIFCVVWWINASAADWWGGWAFGGRRFTSALAVLAPGLALALWWVGRRPMLLVGGATVIAVVWNALFMVQYHRQLVPRDEPVSFGKVMRQQAELWTQQPYRYPFTFPASLWFALREGVPPDRYDLLANEALTPSRELRFDDRVDRYLLDGWQEANEPDPVGPYRWLIERQATLVLPLELPPDAPVVIDILARAERERGPVRVDLSVSVNDHEVGRGGVLTMPSTIRVIVPAADWQRLWRRGYNRVTLRGLAVVALDEAGVATPEAAARERLRLPWPVAVFLLRIDPVMRMALPSS